MVHHRLIEVGGDSHGEDRPQVRRTLHRCLQLSHREVADADHPDVSVAPRLRRCPLDEIVQVTTFLGVEEPERPA